MCLAIPGKVAEVYELQGMRMAKVQFGGITARGLPGVCSRDAGWRSTSWCMWVSPSAQWMKKKRSAPIELLAEMDQLTELEAPVVEEIGTPREATMRYLDEYRDGELAAKIVEDIRNIQTKPWVIMEVCGGQTHSIVKNGID